MSDSAKCPQCGQVEDIEGRLCGLIALEDGEARRSGTPFNYSRFLVRVRNELGLPNAVLIAPKDENVILMNAAQANCSHKFVDSSACLKCGWKPCSQKGCLQVPAFRYTWPGRAETVICESHSKQMTKIVDAMGFTVELIPLQPVSES